MKNFCGLSSKELTNQSNPPDLKVCGLANTDDLVLHIVSPQSNMTPRLWAEQQKGILLWPILWTSGKSEDLEGSNSKASVLLSLSWSLVWMVDIFISLMQFCMMQKRESMLEWGVEQYNSVPSANMWCKTEWYSIISDRGCMYRMKKIGSSLEPWGTPYNKQDGSDSPPGTGAICLLPLKYDQKNATSVSWITKTSLKRFSSRSWSQQVMIYRIKRCTQIQNSQNWNLVRITTSQISLKTWSRAVTVLRGSVRLAHASFYL